MQVKLERRFWEILGRKLLISNESLFGEEEVKELGELYAGGGFFGEEMQEISLKKVWGRIGWEEK